MNAVAFITYTLFIPLLIAPPPVKGIAMADWNFKQQDMAALNASWYYGWGQYCGATPWGNCVNMVREFQLPNSCYEWLMVGNEPSGDEPAGHHETPHDAAVKVIAIEQMCPQTKLVVGNEFWDWWFRDFLIEYQALTGHAYTGRLGAHCYTIGDMVQNCIDHLGGVLAMYSGPWWLTEFNCLSCSAAAITQFVNYAGSHFERFAIYTNRQPPEAYQQGWALAGADLVNADGTLNERGAAYAAWGAAPALTMLSPTTPNQASGRPAGPQQRKTEYHPQPRHR